MNLGAVALKLRNANTRFGNRIVGTAELALAQEYTLQNETAFVIPLSEAVNQPNQNDTFTNQRIIEVFGIVAAIKNDSSVVDKLGFQAYSEHNTVRSQFLRALLGWTMPGSTIASLVYYQGGRVIDITPAWLWYQYEFAVETRITSDVDGVDSDNAAQFTDQFDKLYTQYVFDENETRTLPLTGASPQLPTHLITPTVEELFGPQYAFASAFSSDFDTLKPAAQK